MNVDETICCDKCGYEYDRHVGDLCPNCGHDNHEQHERRYGGDPEKVVDDTADDKEVESADKVTPEIMSFLIRAGMMRDQNRDLIRGEISKIVNQKN